MHIFSDESGGADATNRFFLVTAVRIEAGRAVRLMKKFRKALGTKDEIKGHKLTTAQRRLFLKMLGELAPDAIATVACDRHDIRGGWAMGTMEECQLWGQLTFEAVVGAADSHASPISVTVDGGRYPSTTIQTLSGILKHRLEDRLLRTVHLRPGDSEKEAGLQVADILANSVFHSMGVSETACQVTEMLELARLEIRHVQLDGCTPAWITS